jgi:hypothetical protein
MIIVYSVAAPTDIELPRDVHVARRSSLQCFYSEVQQGRIGAEPEMLRFFQVNQALFAQTDILEFRYPTALEDLSALERFLGDRESALAAEMKRLRGLAQLAVYLQKPPASAAKSPQTGTEYLLARREVLQAEAAAAECVRAAVGPELRDSLTQGDRLLLLVSREAVSRIATRVRTATGYNVIGPFPPSAFVKLLS